MSRSRTGVIMMGGRFGSGIWMPCLSRGPDKGDSSSSLMNTTSQNYLTMYLLPNLPRKKNLIHDWSVGAIVSERLKSVTYPPVAQTWGGWGSTCGILCHSHHRTGAGPGKTRQRSLLWNGSTAVGAIGQLTSFSEVPHMLQHLHSMHCQRYVFTAAIIMGVNCRQDGWPACRKVFFFLALQRFAIFQFDSTVGTAPERPQSEQDTSSSDWPVLWLVLESPKQKSQ